MAGKPQEVDLESLIDAWALTDFRKNATKEERNLLDKELIDREIDWKRVRFQKTEPNYDPEPPTPGSGTPSNNVLFQSSFANKTGDNQTYHFRAERSTRSSCSVTTEEAYTFGMNVELKLPIPAAIFEASVGFNAEMSLSESNQTTHEEQLTWGVDSQITVKPHHHAEAKLIILEEEYNGKFSMETRISGRVRVVFRNLKDNNSFMMAREGQVTKIVSEAMEAGRLRGNAVIVDGATKQVVCKLNGVANFKYGVKQRVEVEQMPLEE